MNIEIILSSWTSGLVYSSPAIQRQNQFLALEHRTPPGGQGEGFTTHSTKHQPGVLVQPGPENNRIMKSSSERVL